MCPAFGAGPITDIQVLDLDVPVTTVTAGLARCKPTIFLNYGVTLVPEHFLEYCPTAFGYGF